MPPRSGGNLSRAVCGREVPDPGFGPDPEGAADAARARRATHHDYVRHGTTTLFATLEIATGQVTGLCKNRHRHQEFLAFLKHLARACPGRELHLVMDNYATHVCPESEVMEM